MPIRSYSGTAPRPAGARSANKKKPVGRPKAQTSALIPAAARLRMGGRLADDEVQLNDHAVETFSRAVGGRQSLTDVLSVAADAPEVQQIVDHLLDHRYARWSLRKLCTMHGISVADLFTAYRKALIAKAHIEATHIIARRLPPIVEDVMVRAAPQEVACDCVGEERPTCRQCHGTGVTLTEPDLDRQKLALELGHLTEKKAGLIVQQNQGVMTSGGAALVAQGSGALEQLQQAVGELLFSPARRRSQAPREPIEPREQIQDPPAEPTESPRQEPPAGAPTPRQDDPDADAQSDEDDEPDDPKTSLH